MDRTQTPTAALRRRRTVLLKRLSTLDAEVIRGSLVERYKRCGKAGCRCMTGKGHGPKYYLTMSLGKGKLDAIYVPQDQVDRVRTYVHNYQRFQEQFKELCDINRELLRRRQLL
jgi:hypothetical protein